MILSVVRNIFFILLLSTISVDAKPTKCETTNSFEPVKTRCDAINYLVYYKYTDDTAEFLSSPDGDDELKEAILAYQILAEIEETGDFNQDTYEHMTLPRCGDDDKVLVTRVRNSNHARRHKRYTLYGTTWKITDLTYRFENYYSELSEATVRMVVRKALDRYEAVTPLRFTLVNSGDAHILVSFGSGSHGDPYPFDGPGKTLAHAFYPSSSNTLFGIHGDAHFDADETFTNLNTAGFNLYLVALHEFGHSLGLAHSSSYSAIMRPYYTRYQSNNPYPDLTTDDIIGIQELYGGPSTTFPRPTTTTTTTIKPTTTTIRLTTTTRKPTTTTRKPTTTTIKPTTTTRKTTTTTRKPTTTTRRPTTTTRKPTTTTRRPTTTTRKPTTTTRRPATTTTTKPTTITQVPISNTPSCSAPIDAMLTGDNTNLYVFQGASVTTLSITNGRSSIVAHRPISDVFPGAPSSIDAAFNYRGYFWWARRHDGAHLCKDGQCWRYSWKNGAYQLYNGYPKTILADFRFDLKGQPLKAALAYSNINFVTDTHYFTNTGGSRTYSGLLRLHPFFRQLSSYQASSGRSGKNFIISDNNIHKWTYTRYGYRFSNLGSAVSFLFNC